MILATSRALSISFYCEYVRRMFDRIEKMVDDMMGSDDSYLPDIFAESSETIIEIITKRCVMLYAIYLRSNMMSNYY